MARLFTVNFARIDSLSTSSHLIFIVPAGHRYTVRQIIVCNGVAAAVQARFYEATENPFYWVGKMAAQYDNALFDGHWTFDAGAEFRVVCNNAGRIGIVVDGWDLRLP